MLQSAQKTEALNWLSENRGKVSRAEAKRKMLEIYPSGMPSRLYSVFKEAYPVRSVAVRPMTQVSGKPSAPGRKISKPSAPGRKLGTLTDFQNTFDTDRVVPAQIEQGLADLTTSEGEPAFMEDREFRVFCGVSVAVWRRYSTDFSDHWVRKGDKIYWGHRDIITEMKRIVSR